jgi:hypothetical protein
MDKFRLDYINAVKENAQRKEEEEKRNKRELAQIAAKNEKEKRALKKAAPSKGRMDLEDESEDVIESLLGQLASGGGNQVNFGFITID